MTKYNFRNKKSKAVVVIDDTDPKTIKKYTDLGYVQAEPVEDWEVSQFGRASYDGINMTQPAVPVKEYRADPKDLYMTPPDVPGYDGPDYLKKDVATPAPVPAQTAKPTPVATAKGKDSSSVPVQLGGTPTPLPVLPKATPAAPAVPPSFPPKTDLGYTPNRTGIGGNFTLPAATPAPWTKGDRGFTGTPEQKKEGKVFGVDPYVDQTNVPIKAENTSGVPVADTATDASGNPEFQSVITPGIPAKLQQKDSDAAEVKAMAEGKIPVEVTTTGTVTPGQATPAPTTTPKPEANKGIGVFPLMDPSNEYPLRDDSADSKTAVATPKAPGAVEPAPVVPATEPAPALPEEKWAPVARVPWDGTGKNPVATPGQYPAHGVTGEQPPERPVTAASTFPTETSRLPGFDISGPEVKQVTEVEDPALKAKQLTLSQQKKQFDPLDQQETRRAYETKKTQGETDVNAFDSKLKQLQGDRLNRVAALAEARGANLEKYMEGLNQNEQRSFISTLVNGLGKLLVGAYDVATGPSTASVSQYYKPPEIFDKKAADATEKEKYAANTASLEATETDQLSFENDTLKNMQTLESMRGKLNSEVYNAAKELMDLQSTLTQSGSTREYVTPAFLWMLQNEKDFRWAMEKLKEKIEMAKAELHAVSSAANSKTLADAKKTTETTKTDKKDSFNIAVDPKLIEPVLLASARIGQLDISTKTLNPNSFTMQEADTLWKEWKRDPLPEKLNAYLDKVREISREILSSPYEGTPEDRTNIIRGIQQYMSILRNPQAAEAAGHPLLADGPRNGFLNMGEWAFNYYSHPDENVGSTSKEVGRSDSVGVTYKGGPTPKPVPTTPPVPGEPKPAPKPAVTPAPTAEVQGIIKERDALRAKATKQGGALSAKDTSRLAELQRLIQSGASASEVKPKNNEAHYGKFR